jgi:hypothetical protein
MKNFNKPFFYFIIFFFAGLVLIFPNIWISNAWGGAQGKFANYGNRAYALLFFMFFAVYAIFHAIAPLKKLAYREFHVAFLMFMLLPFFLTIKAYLVNEKIFPTELYIFNAFQLEYIADFLLVSFVTYEIRLVSYLFFPMQKQVKSV